MGFNFPNAPSSGDQYAPAGGPTYTWDGVAWKAVVQGVPVTVYVSDTAPVSPAIGQLWWNSANGTMAIWYADADSAQWVQVSGAVSATPTAETRNRIVNGAMQVSQENGDTAGTTSSFYAADEWRPAFTTTGASSCQRVQSVTPNGSKNRLRFTVTTADTSLAATEYVVFQNKIEGVRVADFRWGSASAKQIVLRFGFKAPAGTYSVGLTNGAANRTYLVNFVISAGQANTDTEQTFVVPGDTSGTWLTDTGIGCYLTIGLAVGTNAQGVAGWQAGNLFGTASNTNGMGTISNTFELFDVGLYLDPLATGIAPPWVMPDEAEELRACQRYWQKTGSFYINFTSYIAGGVSTFPLTFPVEMRSAPAVTALTAGTLTNVAIAYNDLPFTSHLGRIGINTTAIGNSSINGRVLGFNARM